MCSKKCFIILAFFLTICSAMTAQDASRVYVSFSFENESGKTALLAMNFGSQKTTVAKQISQALDDLFAKKFPYPYWTFQATDQNLYPRLNVWVEKNGGYDLSLRLFSEKNVTNEQWKWTFRFLEPGYVPPNNQLPSDIQNAFDRDILGRNSTAIFDALKSIPLGEAVVMTKPAPTTREDAKVVLPLSWDKYRCLAMSTFKIAYRFTTGGAIVYIHSSANGTINQYPAAPPVPPYDALVAQMDSWESQPQQLEKIDDHLNELPNVKPVCFFLEKYAAEGCTVTKGLAAPSKISSGEHQ